MALVSREEGKEGDGGLPSPWGSGTRDAISASPWHPKAQENGVPHSLHHMHPHSFLLGWHHFPPRPYLPTAKTVRPMVRFCRTASCWATSGSKVPSQIMGAPQEVQVRTSGRALAGAGRERQVHAFTCLVNGHCHPSPAHPVLGPRDHPGPAPRNLHSRSSRVVGDVLPEGHSGWSA